MSLYIVRNQYAHRNKSEWLTEIKNFKTTPDTNLFLLVSGAVLRERSLDSFNKLQK